MSASPDRTPGPDVGALRIPELFSAGPAECPTTALCEMLRRFLAVRS